MAHIHGIKLGQHLIAQGLCPQEAFEVELHMTAAGAIYLRYHVYMLPTDLPKLATALLATYDELKAKAD